MRELALYLAKSLVNEPDKVEAQATEDGDLTRISLAVADEDKGKIIGKQGKVIKAIRSVVGIAGAKTRRKVLLDLD
ncbi:MAG: KH domain-containing protein [Elusimicrobiota bacterium]